MGFQYSLGGEQYVFDDLKTLMAIASPARSGDELAGLAATSDRQRIAARHALADVPLDLFVRTDLIPYEAD
ncbi:MAG: ethanolamine ammonia-lyase subunit EutB, partial [Acetobacter persici]